MCDFLLSVTYRSFFLNDEPIFVVLLTCFIVYLIMDHLHNRVSRSCDQEVYF